MFTEGEGEPAEIARIKRNLRTAAASYEEGGAWLAAAMEQGVLDRAVDLTTESAALVHDNERRWRVFRERAEAVVGTNTSSE